jgi:hypothetical protein
MAVAERAGKSGQRMSSLRAKLATMSTDGEVVNALVCKTSIHGFKSHSVLHKIPGSNNLRGRDNTSIYGFALSSLACDSGLFLLNAYRIC